MITPGEGFFKPAASSLLIVLFCYLCESERENLVFSLKIFCFFSAPLKGRDRQTFPLRNQETEGKSSKKKTTKADRVHNNKSTQTRGERARLNLRERNETSEKAKFCPRIQKRIRIVPLLLQIVYYCSLL